MTFGITEEGFNKKRTEDIVGEMELDVKDTFGNSTDVDPEAPWGQFIGIFSDKLSAIWELSEDLYNSQYPNTSEDATLDNVVALTGITRNGATSSIVDLKAVGTKGTVIPIDSVVSQDGSPTIRFQTTQEATIGDGTNSIQTLTFPSIPTSGTFKLVLDSETTGVINWNDNAAAIKAAIEALANVTEVTVTGDVQDGLVTIEFTGDDAEQSKPLFVIASNLLKSKETVSIDTVADVSQSLDRRYIKLGDSAGTVGLWLQVDSASAAPSGALVLDRQILVNTVNTNDSADTVATKVGAVIGGDSEFENVVVLSNNITFDVVAEVNVADASDGTVVGEETGFTVAVDNQGADTGEIAVAAAETQAGELPNVTIGAKAEDTGPISANSGTLTVIETTVAGWDSVTNPLDAIVGSDVEEDTDLKIRRIEEIATAGAATPAAIKASLLQVPGVTKAVVFINKTDIEDPNGVPPHSVNATVEGGDDQDIADDLFSVVAGGIQTHGDVTLPVIDPEGFPQDTSFDRPDEVLIYVEFDLTIDSSQWPGDGEDQVEAAILAYGNSLDIGDNVIVYPSLLCSVDGIPGILDVVVRVGTSASPTEDDNIVIDADEIAKFDSSRITLDVTVGVI